MQRSMMFFWRTACAVLLLNAGGSNALSSSEATGLDTCIDVSCVKTSHFKSQGRNSTNQEVFVDIGVCRPRFSFRVDGCNAEYSESCPPICQPESYRQQFYNTWTEGPSSEWVVESCYFFPEPCSGQCVRRPRMLHFFPGSNLNRTVDVGSCTGGCRSSSTASGTKCLPTRNRTLAITGPNGFEIVNVIEECSCQPYRCYRVDYYESYTEKSKGALGATEKLINVGKCVGECPGIINPSTCLPSPENCVIWIPSKQAKCVATVGAIEEFTDAKGNNRSIATVVDCGCSTG